MISNYCVHFRIIYGSKTLKFMSAPSSSTNPDSIPDFLLIITNDLILLLSSDIALDTDDADAKSEDQVRNNSELF